MVAKYLACNIVKLFNCFVGNMELCNFLLFSYINYIDINVKNIKRVHRIMKNILFYIRKAGAPRPGFKIHIILSQAPYYCGCFPMYARIPPST